MQPLQQMSRALLRIIGVRQLIQEPRGDLLGGLEEGIALKQALKAHHIQPLAGDLPRVQVYPELAVDFTVGIAHLVAHGLTLLGVQLTDDAPLGRGRVQQAIIDIKEYGGKFHFCPSVARSAAEYLRIRMLL